MEREKDSQELRRRYRQTAPSASHRTSKRAASVGNPSAHRSAHQAILRSSQGGNLGASVKGKGSKASARHQSTSKLPRPIASRSGRKPVRSGSSQYSDRSLPGLERRQSSQGNSRNGTSSSRGSGPSLQSSKRRVSSATDRNNVWRRTGAGDRRSAQRNQNGDSGAKRRKMRNLVVIVLVLLLTIAGVIFTMRLTRHTLTSIEQAVSAPDPAEQFMPVECTADMLTIDFSEKHTYAGSQVSFPITITNAKGKRPCTIDAGYSTVDIQVMTGDVQVWSSRTCKAGQESLPLLLDQGLSHDQQITWPGLVAGGECTGKDPAGSGTYRAKFILGGTQIGEELVFDLPQAPPPPVPADEDNDSKK